MSNNFKEKDLHIVQLLSNEVDKVTSICNSLIKEHNAIIDDYNKLLSEHKDLKSKLKEFIDSVKQESIKACETVIQPDLFISLDETKLSDYLKKPLTKNCPNGHPARRSLTDDQVIQIRKLFKQNFTDNDIAKTYNVKHGTINAIRTGRTYKNIN